MSKHVFEAEPRHRRHWLQAQPKRVVIAFCTLWLVPMLGLWAILSPDDDPRGDAAPGVDAPYGPGTSGIGDLPGPSGSNPADAGAQPPGGAGPGGAGPGAVSPGATGPGQGGPGPGGPGQAGPTVGATGAGGTGRPGAGPTAGGPASGPPVEVRDPEPATPLLTVTQSGAPSNVDLTAEGTLDWIHWGLRSPGSINRKAGGARAIADEGGTGPRERSDTRPHTFSWRDGAPDGAVANTPTCIYAIGLDSGFRFSVAAAAQTRTLRLYAGVLRSEGRLEVSLPGAGLTRTATLASAEQFGSLTKQFTITFRAPAGGRLQVRWVVTKIYNQYGADVSMQAATLR